LPLLIVFAVGFVEIWFAVPTGLALGLPAPVVWGLTASGSLLSTTIVAFGGDALRYRVTHRAGKEPAPRKGRIYAVWLRYGVPGWGLVSPLFMTPPMGTGVALLLGAPRRQLMLWMYAGVVLWTTILVAAGLIGLEVLHSIR
jgi:hypothetical protein